MTAIVAYRVVSEEAIHLVMAADQRVVTDDFTILTDSKRKVIKFDGIGLVGIAGAMPAVNALEEAFHCPDGGEAFLAPLAKEGGPETLDLARAAKSLSNWVKDLLEAAGVTSMEDNSRYHVIVATRYGMWEFRSEGWYQVANGVLEYPGDLECGEDSPITYAVAGSGGEAVRSLARYQPKIDERYSPEDVFDAHLMEWREHAQNMVFAASEINATVSKASTIVSEVFELESTAQLPLDLEGEG